MKKNKKGFTLVELIAVSAIISFLAYVSVPFGESMYKKVRSEKTQDELQIVRDALDLYYNDHGHYPLIPTFTKSTPIDQRFSALEALQRELCGVEYHNYDLNEYGTKVNQKIYLTEFPVNPYTGKKEDWEIRDSYLPVWHPVNQAMNPVEDSTDYGLGGKGTTGTYGGTATNASDALSLANKIGYPVRIQNSFTEGVLAIVNSSTTIVSTVQSLIDSGDILGDIYVSSVALNATGTYFNSANAQKTRDIFDIRFPKYLNRKIKKGIDEKDLSEY